jgi:thiol-disulfide isomerase/thioredoxin
MNKNIISKFNNLIEFFAVLKANPGLLIVKIGATWCNPCKQIKHVVDGVFATTPDTVLCADLDIDEKGNQEIYLLLKNKRMISGIPAILLYKKGNTEIYPTDIVTGSDPLKLHNFFIRCGNHLKTIKNNIEPNEQQEEI